MSVLEAVLFLMALVCMLFGFDLKLEVQRAIVRMIGVICIVSLMLLQK